MIKLDFKRDIDGFYIINKNNGANFSITEVINPFDGSPEECNVWLTQGKNRVVVKTNSDEGYIMSLYAEMLFSKFAEKNNISSAKTDVAIYNGRVSVLSKDVNDSEQSELINCAQLMKMARIKYCNYTVKDFMEMLNTVKDFMNREQYDAVRVGEDFEKDLIRAVVVDFLTWQEDRHWGNLAVKVVCDKKGYRIDLAPLFDNEGVFNLMTFRSKFTEHADYLKKVIECERYSVLEFPYFVLAYVEDEVLDNIPVLGLNRCMTANFNTSEQRKEAFRKYNSSNGIEYLTQVFLEDLVEIVKEGKESLKREIIKLNFDAELYVKEIEEETGFKIPLVFAKFAEIKFYERKKLLLDKFRAYGLENGGDTNEDCVVL